MDYTKLAAAKLWLISEPNPGASGSPPRDQPYLGHALYALVAVPSLEVPTISVDEQWRVYLNPDWVDSASVPEIGAQLAHVTWHLLAEHADRARSLDVDSSTAKLWGKAADASVTETLKPDSLVPAGLCSVGELGVPSTWSTEEIYAKLSRLPPSGSGGGPLEPDEGCGSGCDGVPRSHELPADFDIGGVDLNEAREIRKLVAIEYVEHAKRRGDQPGDAMRWAKKILDPTIAWEPLLTGAVRRAIGWAAGRGDFTYTRPSRRASSVPGVVLPGMRRAIPKVAMVIDTSGSVDDGLLGRALGEVDGALQALGVSGGQVSTYSCDAAVHTVQRVRRARDVGLAGGGGTDMRVGLAMAAAERPRPDVIVVFTDSYTPWPTFAPPSSTVIIALLGRPGERFLPTPSWATTVECLLD